MIILLRHFFWALLVLGAVRVQAASVEELQEIRFAKAELALHDKQLSVARRLLAQNLVENPLHLPSFLLYANLYRQDGEQLSALKVYYFLIKRLHGPWLVVPGKHKKAFVPPRPEALEVYYLIASSYLEMALGNSVSKENQEKIEVMAEKYLRLCIEWNYKEADANLFLARLRSKQQRPDKALPLFLEARKLYVDAGDSAEDIQRLDILLSETLLQQGQLDAATLFLRSVYLSPDASPSLKQYASAYLEAFKGRYAQASVSYSLRNYSNAHSLDTETFDGFDDNEFYKEYYGKKAGTTASIGANLFVTSSLGKHSSGLAIFSFVNEKAQDTLLALRDSRLLALGFEYKYDNFEKSIFRLKYTFSSSATKSSLTSPLSTSSTYQSISPQFTYALSSGTITYALPFSSTHYHSSGEDLKTLGTEITYSLYPKGKWLSPSLSLGYAPLSEESAPVANSKRTSLSLINSSQPTDAHGLFSGLTYSQNTNADEAYDYSEISASLNYTYTIPWIRGAYLSLGSSLRRKSSSDGRKISSDTYNAGLSYSF
jgi:tetratricopeptide (TPR) repeat protein